LLGPQCILHLSLTNAAKQQHMQDMFVMLTQLAIWGSKMFCLVANAMTMDQKLTDWLSSGGMTLTNMLLQLVALADNRGCSNIYPRYPISHTNVHCTVYTHTYIPQLNCNCLLPGSLHFGLGFQASRVVACVYAYDMQILWYQCIRTHTCRWNCLASVRFTLGIKACKP